MNQQDPESPQTSSIVTSRPRTVMDGDNASWYRVFGIAGNIGWMIAVPAVLFVMGGAWLDGYLETKPLFTLIGIPVALMTSAMAVWRLIRQVQNNEATKATEGTKGTDEKEER